ncbi:MAG: hypothetical protein HS099_06640 [Ardenticatenaceae bacterium]|nr:hypothetical protein [Ardenticatenaceae bacterium]
MNSETMQYASYLVRLWRHDGATGSQPTPYHAEVEHIQTGQRRHFHTPADLYAFLHQPTPTGEQNETTDD